MPKKTAAAAPVLAPAPEVAPVDPNLHLCPTCGIATTYQCAICGATRSTNAVNQAIIWMRNGRVVEAFHSATQAWRVTAARFRISPDSIPPQFRTSTPLVED